MTTFKGASILGVFLVILGLRLDPLRSERCSLASLDVDEIGLSNRLSLDRNLGTPQYYLNHFQKV